MLDASVLIEMVHRPGCKSVFPQQVASGSSKVPFRPCRALASKVERPSAKPVRAKRIIKCFQVPGPRTRYEPAPGCLAAASCGSFHNTSSALTKCGGRRVALPIARFWRGNAKFSQLAEANSL